MKYYDNFYNEYNDLFEEVESSLLELLSSKKEDYEPIWTSVLKRLHSIKEASKKIKNEGLGKHCLLAEDFCSTVKDIRSVENLESLVVYMFKVLDRARIYLKEPENSIAFKHLQEIDQLNNYENDKESLKADFFEFVIVDDDELFLDCIRLVLKETTNNIKVFTAAMEALEYLKGRNDCIVLSDIEMSQLNGVDFFREVRKFSDIPFVFVTAVDSSKVFIELLNEGAFAVLQKPCSPDQVTYVVKQVLKYSTERYVANKSLKNLVVHFEILIQHYKKKNIKFLVDDLRNEIGNLYNMESRFLDSIAPVED